MQNDPNEFVFKRKRKRIRIESLDLETVDQELDPRLIPEIAVLAEPTTSSQTIPDDPILPSSNTDVAWPDNVVTVEKFLRSAEAAPQNKPNLKKQHAYNRQRPPRKAAKPSKKSSESPNVARNLYRAAVLTNGDPLDALVDGARVSLGARRPLKFVPYNKFASPSRKKRGKDREEEAAPRTRRPSSRPVPPSSKRIPLTFIPFREAEAAYAAKFPHKRAFSACGTHS